jgi:hypothetical protein
MFDQEEEEEEGKAHAAFGGSAEAREAPAEGASKPPRHPSARSLSQPAPPLPMPGMARGLSTSQMACCLSGQGSSDEPSGVPEAPRSP